VRIFKFGFALEAMQQQGKEGTMTAPYFDDNAEPVLVVMPVFHDDKPEPVESSRAETLRRIITILEDGPAHTMAARLEALKLVWGMSDLSIRQAAQKARCGPVTIFNARRRLEQFFGGKSEKR
jgi:hypothetical protein